jgi:DTW domain-containing protein YfiP
LAVLQCVCAYTPRVDTRAGMCLLMGDIEAVKPSNTGWLIADVVPDTFAFEWSRTAVDARLLDLLADPQWSPVLVFPGEFAPRERVHTQWPAAAGGGSPSTKRPLFVLLDGTWSEARKMFRKSPYLDRLPVLSLNPARASAYRLRRSQRDDHFCTAEVAAMCLEMAAEPHAAAVLWAYFEVFSAHYLAAQSKQKLDLNDAAHQGLAALMTAQAPSAKPSSV